jgi:hypothetical protein
MLYSLLLQIDSRLRALEKAARIEQEEPPAAPLPGTPPIICDDPSVNGCIPNAETLRAFAEGEAIERGKIPSKDFKSFEEFWTSLDED